MSSRFVITEKQEDNHTRVTSRWCLRGHHDPDLMQKVLAGKCHSSTLSQLSRNIILQLIVSHQWTLNLGDIKGAFLEANVLKQALENPVFAELPPGGVPGIKPGSLVQVLGNIYGANDAPANWYKEFDDVTLQSGFSRSKFDSCLYFCRGPNGELQGVLGAHVDDTITGGSGEVYKQAICTLKKRFPFRKWRTLSGEFLGTWYEQDPITQEISYHQQDYANSIKPIHVSRERVLGLWMGPWDGWVHNPGQILLFRHQCLNKHFQCPPFKTCYKWIKLFVARDNNLTWESQCLIFPPKKSLQCFGQMQRLPMLNLCILRADGCWLWTQRVSLLEKMFPSTALVGGRIACRELCLPLPAERLRVLL